MTIAPPVRGRLPTGPTDRPAAAVTRERAGRALASPLRLHVHGGTELDADRAWEAVRSVFDAVDRAMSRFREDSELVRLWSAPASSPVSRMLRRALVAADRARRVTGGRFEPRILSALEAIGYDGVPVPAGRTAMAASPAARERVLELDRAGRVTLPEPVDLGGIGKGLALRWAADAVAGLNDNGIAGFLVDAGGDIVVAGAGPSEGSWSIGIEAATVEPQSATPALSDPASADEGPVAVLGLRGREAVATSSTRRLRWSRDGVIVHHLLDPSTGLPGGNGLLAVTVAGPDPAWCEVWSKALFLAGRRRIADDARRHGLAAWWIAEDATLEMTAAARQRTTWVATEV